MNIEFDEFIRTTDKRHEAAVKKLIKRIYERDDIYEGTYEGLYCVPCESYWTEKELVSGKCPTCGREVQPFKEKAYFFRLSKYQNALLALYKKNPDFVMPKSKMHEMRNRIEGGLNDVSFTRSKFKWGVEFPIDKNYVLWVWPDALINYISALGWPRGKNFRAFWPADLHLIGKDILWFHTVIWPAMLLSAGIAPPKKVFAHGWWTVEGEKMSKSRGNVVDPLLLSEKYGADAVRYFLLREVPFGMDGDFSESALVARINAELADDLGNLLSRTLAMVERYFGGKIPEAKKPVTELKDASGIIAAVNAKMDSLQFSEALQLIWNFISICNKYITESQPWELHKQGRKEELASAIYSLSESLRIIAILASPFMPEKSAEILRQLNVPEKFSLKDAKWGGLKPSTRIRKGDVLFKKVSLEIDEFSKFDLRIGKILSAKEHPDADRLYILQIDFGDNKRQIVSGIREYYKKEELAGKKAVFICNLKPAKFRGIESQGMILAADDGAPSILLAENSEPGASVFAEGISKKPTVQITFDEFQKLEILIDGAGFALYGGKKLRTQSEEIKTERKVSEGARVR